MSIKSEKKTSLISKHCKKFVKFSKIELAEMLGLDFNMISERSARKPSKPICVTNLATNEKTICQSFSKCEKFLDKNSGSIYHFLTSGHILKKYCESFHLTYA